MYGRQVSKLIAFAKNLLPGLAVAALGAAATSLRLTKAKRPEAVQVVFAVGVKLLSGLFALLQTAKHFPSYRHCPLIGLFASLHLQRSTMSLATVPQTVSPGLARFRIRYSENMAPAHKR
jgi:hypothetical protein